MVGDKCLLEKCKEPLFVIFDHLMGIVRDKCVVEKSKEPLIDKDILCWKIYGMVVDHLTLKD